MGPRVGTAGRGAYGDRSVQGLASMGIGISRIWCIQQLVYMGRGVYWGRGKGVGAGGTKGFGPGKIKSVSLSLKCTPARPAPGWGQRGRCTQGFGPGKIIKSVSLLKEK